MRTVWDISNNKEKRELRIWEASYPKAPKVLKRMIQLSSREGDIMLHPFSGLGVNV